MGGQEELEDEATHVVCVAVRVSELVCDGIQQKVSSLVVEFAAEKYKKLETGAAHLGACYKFSKVSALIYLVYKGHYIVGPIRKPILISSLYSDFI